MRETKVEFSKPLDIAVDIDTALKNYGILKDTFSE